MERWMWFEAFNASGKWGLVEGYAEVTITGRKLRAVLRISPDTLPHLTIDATVTKAGDVKATVAQSDKFTFKLKGEMYSGESPEGSITHITLTGGDTVIGLAHGPWTAHGNLVAENQKRRNKLESKKIPKLRRASKRAK
jgi:hypothetical protein